MVEAAGTAPASFERIRYPDYNHGRNISTAMVTVKWVFR